jgi:hypothetical protein
MNARTSTEQEYYAALQRLLDRKATVSINAVAIEAGKKQGSLRAARYPELVAEINRVIELQAKKDMKIVFKEGAEKSTVTCEKKAEVQIDNRTKKNISVKMADGTKENITSGEVATITPDGKKEDRSDEDKNDSKDETKENQDSDTSGGNSSGGSSSGGTIENPSKRTEAELLKEGYQLKWQDNFANILQYA